MRACTSWAYKMRVMDILKTQKSSVSKRWQSRHLLDVHTFIHTWSHTFTLLLVILARTNSSPNLMFWIKFLRLHWVHTVFSADSMPVKPSQIQMDVKCLNVSGDTVFAPCKSPIVILCLVTCSLVIYSPEAVLLLWGWWHQRATSVRENRVKPLMCVTQP